MALWTYIEGFVAAPGPLFDRLREQLAWTSQMASRQTASMGIPYNYAGGGERTIQIRKGDGLQFEYTRLALAAGSLLFMTAAMQAKYKHALKRQAGAGERISLSFRHLTLALPPVDRDAWGRVSTV